MRIPISTDIKTRTGVPANKDARLVNSYIEGKGDPQQPDYQSAVRKRAVAQGGIAIGPGVAQGGIGITVGGVPSIVTFNGDVARLNNLGNIAPGWSSSVNYVVGDPVYYPTPSDPFANTNPPYYAIIPNTNVVPTTPYYWSTTKPTATRYQATFSGTAGLICGSANSAGYSAYLTYPFQNCATKFNQGWIEYAGLSGINVMGHQYQDSSPFTCSTTPTDYGIVGLGTVTTI